MELLTPTEIWLSQTQIDIWKLYAFTSIIHNASQIESRSTRFHGGNLTNQSTEKVELMKVARSLREKYLNNEMREAIGTLISRPVNVN